MNARLAVQRGEIHLHSESMPGYLSVVAPTMVKEGMVIPLYYDPEYDGETFSAPAAMKGSTIQSFPEFYRAVRGGTPSGPLWDAYRTSKKLARVRVPGVFTRQLGEELPDPR